MTNELISPKYLQEQIRLHAQPRGYGGRGDRWADYVGFLIREHSFNSVLDYGCGQGSLIKALRPHHDINLYEYDLAIPGKTEAHAADLVVCTDVLEHIEPDKLDAVLDHMFGLANKMAFIVVATRPSNKRLSDGRNAHLTIKPAVWWRERLMLKATDFHLSPKRPDTAGRQRGLEWIALMKRG